MQTHQTEFKLSREYLAECYDQTLPHSKNTKPNFLFPIVAAVAGVTLLLYTDQPKPAGIVLLAIAALELVHIKFRRSWWLLRQVWSKNGNSMITLEIDENRIQTRSNNTVTTLPWNNVSSTIETDAGLILIDRNGAQQYLSKAVLTDEIIQKCRDLNQSESD